VKFSNNRRTFGTATVLGALLLSSTPADPRPKVIPKPLPALSADPFCSAKSARLMILGTYHFANPGLDAKNVNADDVLAPRRQAEIEELTEKLAAFKPTKIMVEAPHGDGSVQKAYKAYLAGTHKLEHDETQQIGFRLAKKLNLPRIYPIDFPMRMSGLRSDEVDDNWRPKPAPAPPGSTQALAAPAPAELTEEDRLLRASTITEIFLRMNDPAKVEARHADSYLELLLPEDSAAIYARSDYFVNWYKRNVRMFANVARYTKFPDDNVLVIAGSGHLKILRDLARDAPYFCLVEPNAFLTASAQPGRRR
jgi:hypothetical protein